MVACTSAADLMASSEFAHNNIINKAKSQNYYCLQQSNYLTVHTSHPGVRVQWPSRIDFLKAYITSILASALHWWGPEGQNNIVCS